MGRRGALGGGVGDVGADGVLGEGDQHLPLRGRHLPAPDPQHLRPGHAAPLRGGVRGEGGSRDWVRRVGGLYPTSA